jgi:hypothetical protein
LIAALIFGHCVKRRVEMLRLASFGAVALFATAAIAQQGAPPKGGKPDPAKLAKCQQLARDRGFSSGVENAKGGTNMRSFVIACMQGKQT